MNVKKYSVSGMTCDGCVKSIKTKLELVDDIVSAEVSLNDEYLLLSSEKNYEESEINEPVSYTHLTLPTNREV